MLGTLTLHTNYGDGQTNFNLVIWDNFIAAKIISPLEQLKKSQDFKNVKQCVSFCFVFFVSECNCNLNLICIYL